MDQKNQEQPKEQENDVPTQTQTHNENQNQSNQIVPVSRPLIHTTGASAFSSYLSREQCLQRSSIYTIQQRKQQALQKKLNTFWANQNQEVMETTDFKANPLPLARIKKIMKADEGVSMISAEAPLLFAKACEMFITELTMRSWANTDADKRKTLQKSDIASAISRNDMFDFLVDIVPRETTLEHNMFMNLPRRENASSANVPYYYAPVPVPAPMPPSQDATGSSNGPPRMLMGRSLIDKTQYKKDGNSSDLQGSDD